LDDVQCRGTETDIASCPHIRWGAHNCGHSEDISVRCTEPPTAGTIATCSLERYTVTPKNCTILFLRQHGM